jgi:hypothetical protein
MKNWVSSLAPKPLFILIAIDLDAHFFEGAQLDERLCLLEGKFTL